jgi:hypothetical protein
MKILLLAFIFLLSFSALAVSDFSSYWSGIPRQKMLFSCHTFVTTGLIEALYAEVYKKQIDLSEADLFGRHFFGSEEEGLNFLYQQYQNPQDVVDTEFAQKQRGDIIPNLEIIQNYGIKMESELPYILASDLMNRIHTDLKKMKKQRTPNAWQNFVNAQSKVIKAIFQPTGTSEFIREFISGYRVWQMPMYFDIEQRKEMFLSYLSCRPMSISFPVRIMRPNSGGSHVIIARGIDATGTRILTRDSANIVGNNSVDLDLLIRNAEEISMLLEADQSGPARDCP